MRRIIASVDIGTNSIKIVIGEIFRQKLNILAAVESPSSGIKKGVIVNAEEAIKAIEKALKKAEELLGVKINKVIVAIPEYDAEFYIGEGNEKILNPERIIKGVDIAKAMQNSSENQIPYGLELINITPSNYIVNGALVDDPKGMISKEVKVQTVLAMAPKKNVYSTLGALDALHIKVADIAFGSIGDYNAHKTPEMEKSVGAIINLGEETTTVSVFNKGILTSTEVIDLGRQNIENDLIFIYKVEKKVARKLLSNLVLMHNRNANPNEKKEVTNTLGEKIVINQYEASEIAMSRLLEILNLTKKQINHLTKKEISYIIITGGLSESKDFELAVESIFGHNAKIGTINELGVRNNKYSTCVGLIKYFNDRLNLKDKEFSIFTTEELEELVNVDKRVNVSENSVLGKVFGYFFDN